MEFFSVGAQARGFIAIGAEAEGVIAIGQVARGVFAFGQMATGVVAVGQLARGVFVLGQLGVGVFVLGQGAVAIAKGTGMIAIAGRAGGMIPISALPAPAEEGWKPATIAKVSELEQGVSSYGWMRARFDFVGAEVRATVDGQARPTWKINEEVARAVRDEGKREGWIRVERSEVVSARQEGGFREAAERTIELTITSATWIARTSTARIVAAVIGMAVIVAGVSAISLYPVIEVFASLMSAR